MNTWHLMNGKITTEYLEELSRLLREWIAEKDNYSVIHFAAEHNISKDKLFRLAGENEKLKETLDYAFTVMEFKITEGALSGKLEKTVVLKMLETYSGWKSDVNILQKNEYKSYMNEAQRRAEEVLQNDKPVLPDNVTVDSLTGEK